MERRHLTTAVTLVVLLAILALGMVVGIRTLLAPIPGDEKVSADPSPSCVEKTVKKGQKVRARTVTVSVFNGGTRANLADDTMRALAKRGFDRGSIGNSPTKVRRVRVLTTEKNDTAAALVARQFGKRTKVVVTKTDLGPGVDVIVGNGFERLAKAKRAMVARASTSVCVSATPSPTTDQG